MGAPFRYDPFGHLRPGKSALFAVTAFALHPTTASATAWLSASPYVLCGAFLWLHVLLGDAALRRRRAHLSWVGWATGSVVTACLAGMGRWEEGRQALRQLLHQYPGRPELKALTNRPAEPAN